MTDDERTKYSIANLPAADANPKGTMAAEEVAQILARYHAKTAASVVTVGQEQRQREEREATERAVQAAMEQERRTIAVYDADARRRRGDANICFGQSVAVVGAATALGMVIGGTRGALGGGIVGWIIDRVTQGR